MIFLRLHLPSKFTLLTSSYPVEQNPPTHLSASLINKSDTESTIYQCHNWKSISVLHLTRLIISSNTSSWITPCYFNFLLFDNWFTFTTKQQIWSNTTATETRTATFIEPLSLLRILQGNIALWTGGTMANTGEHQRGLRKFPMLSEEIYGKNPLFRQNRSWRAQSRPSIKPTLGGFI